MINDTLKKLGGIIMELNFEDCETLPKELKLRYKEDKEFKAYLIKTNPLLAYMLEEYTKKEKMRNDI